MNALLKQLKYAYLGYWLAIVMLVVLCQFRVIPTLLWSEEVYVKYVVQILAVIKTMLAVINGHSYIEKRVKGMRQLPFDEALKDYRHVRMKTMRIFSMLMALDMVLFYGFGDKTAAFLWLIAAAMMLYFMPTRRSVERDLEIIHANDNTEQPQ